MSENNKISIQESFDDSLISDLSGINKDLTEVLIDQILDDGIIKDIPIVGVFAKVLSIGVNVRDRLFLKKVLSFLKPINDISKEKREEMIEEINKDKKYKIKVGEKLLYHIDSCRDHENSERLGILFKAFLEEKISYDEFIEASNIIRLLAKPKFNPYF